MGNAGARRPDDPPRHGVDARRSVAVESGARAAFSRGAMIRPVPGSSISIRMMRRADIADAASVQEKFLEGSVITALGAMFLRQFHRAALQHGATSAHVAL